MNGKDIWTRLRVWQPWGSGTRRLGDAEEPDDRRQRCLERLAAKGLPLWSEEPEHCDRCHRELLLGEHAVLMSSGEGLRLACPLCAPLLLEEGYRSLTCSPSASRQPRSEEGAS